MSGSTAETVVVIGAGIVGVSAGLWLQRAGCKVILIDREAPGDSTSFGNAGVVAACSVTPVTAPGLARKAPGYLLDPDFPLFVVWRRLPWIAPWLVRYLMHTNDRDTRRIASGIAGVVADSVQQHLDLAGNTAAANWLEKSSYVFAYRSRTEFEKDRYVWDLRRQAGFVPEEIEGPAVRDMLPEINPSIGFLASMSDHGFVTNPGQYVKDLAATLEGAGGSVVRATVQDFDLGSGTIRAVDTSAGRFDCTSAVIAAGVWSRDLMRKLGLRIPLQSERGYHIQLRNPSFMPSCPVMVAAGKFVATPMAAGLRCAGVLEFGGLNQPPSRSPLSLVRKQVAETFPGLSWESDEEWSGHRPAPSDSVPLIGQIRSTRVFAAFGHHHIGLTAGPKTGRLTASLVTGTDAGMDMSPYDPGRFA